MNWRLDGRHEGPARVETTENQTESMPPPLPPTGTTRFRDFFFVLFVSVAVLYTHLRAMLWLTRVLEATYAELDLAIPLVTVQSMWIVEGAVRHGRLYLGLTPLLLATCHVLLHRRPRFRRALVLIVVLGAVALSCLLLVCQLLPLIQTLPEG